MLLRSPMCCAVLCCPVPWCPCHAALCCVTSGTPEDWDPAEGLAPQQLADMERDYEQQLQRRRNSQDVARDKWITPLLDWEVREGQQVYAETPWLCTRMFPLSASCWAFEGRGCSRVCLFQGVGLFLKGYTPASLVHWCNCMLSPHICPMLHHLPGIHRELARPAAIQWDQLVQSMSMQPCFKCNSHPECA
jgi:hypothetical protein